MVWVPSAPSVNQSGMRYGPYSPPHSSIRAVADGRKRSGGEVDRRRAVRGAAAPDQQGAAALLDADIDEVLAGDRVVGDQVGEVDPAGVRERRDGVAAVRRVPARGGEDVGR